MRTLLYRSYLMPNQEWIVFTIKGTNLWKFVLKGLDNLAKAVFEISGSKIYKLYLMIDDTETAKTGNVSYRYYVKYKKTWDDYSRFWTYVKTNGWQNIKTKESEVTFKISPYLETKFEYANTIHRSLLWAYHYMWYNNRVLDLLELSKELNRRFIEEIKAKLGASKFDKGLLDAWRMGE